MIIIQKLKEIYLKNAIIQFLVSYILVLIIPLFAIWYGFQSAFDIVENDIKESNISMLNHSISIIDAELDVLERMALQTSQNGSIRAVSDVNEVKDKSISVTMDALEQFYNLMRYQSVSLLNEAYIQFKQINLIIYDYTYYRPEIFEKYVMQMGITMEEWIRICENDGSRIPRYVADSNNGLQYIRPFSSRLQGESKGVIIYRLETNELKRLLDFSGKYEKYSVFVMDKNNNILWGEDELDYLGSIDSLTLTESGFFQIEGKSIVYAADNESKWNYLLVVPNKEALEKLTLLKVSLNLLILITSAIGVTLSLVLSINKGKPINDIFKIIDYSGERFVDTKHLGEVVNDILKDHAELKEELEQDKPLLQNAFFHNLIKAEFANMAELHFTAQKAGIAMEGKNYRVVSFAIFPNNERYEVDEQTLEEVRIIFQLLIKHITDNYKKSVLFYKKNYLVTLGIFEIGENVDFLLELIESTRYWIFEEYSVDTHWGISDVCNNLLMIWKSTEEAAIAMNHCTDEEHIVKYTTDLDNIYDFYFPDIAEENLILSIHSADINGVDNVIGILEKENCINRKLPRSQFIKLNRSITEMLSNPENFNIDIKKRIIWLNEIVINTESTYESYFERLREICHRLCQEINENKNRQRNQLIENIMRYIQENYMDTSLGLSKIGILFGISEGYLSSIFKEQAGVNFADYLETTRIEKACQLLKNGETTVNEIAELVGYNSVQSFRRAFKRVKGISPKEAR